MLVLCKHGFVYCQAIGHAVLCAVMILDDEPDSG